MKTILFLTLSAQIFVISGCSAPGVIVKKGSDGSTTVIASSPSIFEDALSDTYIVSANIQGVGEFSINSQKVQKDQTEVANAYFTTEVAKSMISGATAQRRSDNSVSKVRSNNSVSKAKIDADKAVKLKALEVTPVE